MGTTHHKKASTRQTIPCFILPRALLAHRRHRYVLCKPPRLLRSTRLSVCLYVCLCVCLSVRPSVRLSVRPSVCLSVCLSFACKLKCRHKLVQFCFSWPFQGPHKPHEIHPYLVRPWGFASCVKNSNAFYIWCVRGIWPILLSMYFNISIHQYLLANMSMSMLVNEEVSVFGIQFVNKW